MATFPASPSPADVVAATEFLPALLALMPLGVVGYAPVFDAAGTVVDFTFSYLNPAAQRLLKLPPRPALTYTQQFPASRTTGDLAFHLATYQSGGPGQFEGSYQADGHDQYFQLAGQRLGDKLLITLAEATGPSPSAIEATLRASQAREQAARQEAERQCQQLQALVDQSPVAIGYFEGPNLRVTAANPLLSAMWGRTQADVLGRPLLEAVPELSGQGFEDLLAQVRETGMSFTSTEFSAQILRDGQLATTYYNFVYQPLYDTQGQVQGVIDVAVEVTEQVLARHLLEEKERQTNFLNEQLQAANQEILANNAELEHTQQQLRQLNEALEARVQQRTRQLDEQRSLLGHILAQVPAYITTFSGPEHRYSFFNAHYQQLAAGRAVLGRPVAETMPEVAEQGFIDLLDQVYHSGQPYVGSKIAVLLKQPNGPAVQHYVNFTYQPLTDGQGQPQGILAFAVDVTEQVRSRRQAETLQAAMLAVAQRQAQQRQDLYQVFEQTPVAIVLLREPDHRIDYFNPAFQALFPPEEWPGSIQNHTISEVYPRIKLAGLVALLDIVYLTGESQTVLDMPLANLQPGSPRYVTFAYQAYREAGRIVGVAAFVYDVTEQVLARQVREVQQAELQRVFAQAPLAITLLRGPHHTVEMLNEVGGLILGATPAQVLGRPFFEALPALRGQGLEAFYQRALQGNTFVVEELRLPSPHPEPSVENYYRVTYQPWRGERGEVIGLIVMGIDITEQVRARQQVQALNEEMRAANVALHDTNTRLTRTNADLDTFVYSASHDLKSPITNIEGLLLALRQQLPPEALYAELVPQLLAMMDGAVRRFQQTLGYLTDVSRLQQHLFDQPAEVVDLPTLVEAVRLDMLPELTAASATLTVDVAMCGTLNFSVKNLRSILYNLLSNAVKYHDPARLPLVQLRCHRAEPGQIVLTVQDNGLGLSTAQQGELFRLFRRLHSHVEGSGVGLYMVQKMVENAGGVLSVQSQPGVGSTFTVRLPTLLLP